MNKAESQAQIYSSTTHSVWRFHLCALRVCVRAPVSELVQRLWAREHVFSLRPIIMNGVWQHDVQPSPLVGGWHSAAGWRVAWLAGVTPLRRMLPAGSTLRAQRPTPPTAKLWVGGGCHLGAHNGTTVSGIPFCYLNFFFKDQKGLNRIFDKPSVGSWAEGSWRSFTHHKAVCWWAKTRMGIRTFKLVWLLLTDQSEWSTLFKVDEAQRKDIYLKRS